MTKVATQTLIPIVRELPADLETPISVYLKLAGNGPSFLLESVTGGEFVARYSFLGVDLCDAFILKDDQWDFFGGDENPPIPIEQAQTPLQVLRDHLGMVANPAASLIPVAREFSSMVIISTQRILRTSRNSVSW